MPTHTYDNKQRVMINPPSARKRNKKGLVVSVVQLFATCSLPD